MKALVWVVIIVVGGLLFLGALWLGTSGQSDIEEEMSKAEEVLKVNQSFVEEKLVSSPVPEIAIEEAKLEAVGTYAGEGEAARSWDGETFGHVVTADLPDPPEDKFYEGWLVSLQSSPQFFSTGRMNKQENKYALIFMDSHNYPEYNQVVITEESVANGLDGKPETHVLEGSF